MRRASKFPNLVEYSFEAGNRLLKQKDQAAVKQYGQFLTPPSIADFMARQLGKINTGARILEPALGSSTLVCAVIEELISRKEPIEIWIDGYETDPLLCRLAREILGIAEEKAVQSGIIVHWEVIESDFVIECAPTSQPSFFPNHGCRESTYDFIISNPPYFKLSSSDPRSRIGTGKIKGHTNIYTLFMAVSIGMLQPMGKACFITPRSFCSGIYFSQFRKELLTNAQLLSFHLFDSRNDLFTEGEVLQENVIITLSRKCHSGQVELDIENNINISTSKNISGLNGTRIVRSVSPHHVIHQRNGLLVLRIPTGVLDERILETLDTWKDTFDSLGLEVSTGPVVPFRALNLLKVVNDVARGEAYPLLWMQHVQSNQVIWPIVDLKKKQGISVQAPAIYLTPKRNYVLLRRFSAKEDRRRLTAAPFLSDQFAFDHVGIENHLNYIRGVWRELTRNQAIGIAALLNSSLIDRFFRITNGNTQVNAAELRALPLPSMDVIQWIGNQIDGIGHEVVERTIFSSLMKAGLLSEDIPLLKETRITMGKIEETQQILRDLGLPTAQQNEISALTLLVMAGLSETTLWENARSQDLRVHDILLKIDEFYHREYAENTRETVRRQVLHQFIQAGICVRNPEDPSLATNSPKTYYRLTDIAIDTIRAFGGPGWENAVVNFLQSRGSLLLRYQKAVEQNKVPVRVSEGEEYLLSPGKHNRLQAQVLHVFKQIFAPDSELLYMGDTSNKAQVFDQDRLLALDIHVSAHSKLPDIILYDSQRNRIYLIEVVTSHGPISPKRQIELDEVCKQCLATRIYVSVFLDFKTFKQFVDKIAWETEVWIAEMPDHLIHFNGDKFL